MDKTAKVIWIAVCILIIVNAILNFRVEQATDEYIKLIQEQNLEIEKQAVEILEQNVLLREQNRILMELEVK